MWPYWIFIPLLSLVLHSDSVAFKHHRRRRRSECIFDPQPVVGGCGDVAGDQTNENDRCQLTVAITGACSTIKTRGYSNGMEWRGNSGGDFYPRSCSRSALSHNGTTVGLVSWIGLIFISSSVWWIDLLLRSGFHFDCAAADEDSTWNSASCRIGSIISVQRSIRKQ